MKCEFQVFCSMIYTVYTCRHKQTHIHVYTDTDVYVYIHTYTIYPSVDLAAQTQD